MVQFCARNMGQSRARSAAGAARDAPPGRPGGRAPRGRTQPAARAGPLLPSSRALAAELGLARNTVADAYGQLVAEGWLTARQGAGTRVAEPAGPPPGRARNGGRTGQPGPQLRPVAGGAGPLGVPARRLAGGRPQGAGRRAERGLRLPGPARAARAAARRWPTTWPGSAAYEPPRRTSSSAPASRRPSPCWRPRCVSAPARAWRSRGTGSRTTARSSSPRRWPPRCSASTSGARYSELGRQRTPGACC